jgi:acyl-CoA thioesterase FadM
VDAMNLIFRMIRVMLAARRRPRVGGLDETSLTFRVWPTDLDVLMHMNNGRYFTLMDLGRADAVLRNGIYASLKARDWYPVVASESIRFRESLPLFARFEVRTRTLGWDDTSFYLRQLFLVRGRVTAIALVRVRFLKRSGGTLTASEVAQAIMAGAVSPVLPPYVMVWRQAESSLAQATSIESRQNHRTTLGV